jgi:hypothetical protein
MTNIPPGYQLHVSTWENDGDSHATQIWSGLTQEDCAFLIELSKKFESSSLHRGGLGNDGTTTTQLLGAFFDVFNRHHHVSSDMRELFSDVIIAEEDDEEAAEILYTILCERLLGYPSDEFYSTNYDNFCRVVDGFEVFYFPEEVKNVTHLFS